MGNIMFDACKACGLVPAWMSHEDISEFRREASKFMIVAVLATLALHLFGGMAFAASPEDSAKEAIKTVVNLVFIITSALAVFFILIGTVRFLIAMSQQDSPAQQTATLWFAVGVALLLVRILLGTLNLENWLVTSFS